MAKTDWRYMSVWEFPLFWILSRLGRGISDSGVVVFFSFLFVSVTCTPHSAAFRRMSWFFFFFDRCLDIAKFLLIECYLMSERIENENREF